MKCNWFQNTFIQTTAWSNQIVWVIIHCCSHCNCHHPCYCCHHSHLHMSTNSNYLAILNTNVFVYPSDICICFILILKVFFVWPFDILWDRIRSILNVRVRLITKSDQTIYQIGIKLDIHIIQAGKSLETNILSNCWHSVAGNSEY